MVDLRSSYYRKNELRPESRPGHWAYYLLYALGIVAALWQHGHAALTLSLLGAIIPAALLAYVPYRFLNKLCRGVLHAVVVIGAIIWLVYRLNGATPLDKALIEFIAILGLSFAFTSRPSSYGFQLLVSALLLVYGALLPRTIYLYILSAALAVSLSLLYLSRTAALAGESLARPAKNLLARNWHHLFVHALIAALVMGYIYSSLPIKRPPGQGLITVSFLTENDNYLAPHARDWLKADTAVAAAGDDADKAAPGSDNATPSPNGVPLKSLDQKQSSGISVPGEGGAAGQDLLFTVKSPVKLYWLATLYDRYDGTTWATTEKLKRQRVNWQSMSLFANPSKSVRQIFTVDKWMSPALCAAFRPVFYVMPPKTPATRETFFNKRFVGKDMPPTPFTYEASSRVPYVDDSPDTARLASGRKQDHSLWEERCDRKRYLGLPQRKITPRLRELAAELVVGVQSPYQKALALRDHLRESYHYLQDNKPVPPGMETVDYFLFDLKEGNCQYFAAALTVLARLNGLPARVAVGFSPGNYNALSKGFEVYEYHAHAWSQIFIEGKGWLTFDGTPPDAVISKTTPLGFGSFRDPFGDEWRVVPPELTASTQEEVKPEFSLVSKNIIPDSPKIDLKESMLLKILTLPEKVEGLNPAKNEKVKEDAKPKFSLKDAKEAFKRNLKSMLDALLHTWNRLGKWVLASSQDLLLLALVLYILLHSFWPSLTRFVRKRRSLRKCRRWLREADHLRMSDPSGSVRCCYRATRELLELADWPRRDNMELFDYGHSLTKLDPELSANALALYGLYSRGEYSPSPPNFEDAGMAREKALHIRDFVFAKLKLKA